jgi:hypothetical protein
VGHWGEPIEASEHSKLINFNITIMDDVPKQLGSAEFST